MKARNLFQILGFRSKPKHYSYLKSEHLIDGEPILYYRWRHPIEIKKSINQASVDQYREIMGEGDFCIDLGAHTGDSTLPLALAVGKSGHVLALEPNPFVYHVLEKNVRANSKRVSITSVLAAAMAEEGFIEFEYSDSGFCNGGRHQDMSIFQHGHAFKQEVFGVDLVQELDQAFAEWLPRLKFIKVDAEGYDLSILESISDLVERCRPVIKAEIFSKTSPEYRKGMLTYFTSRNYALFRVGEDPIGKAEPITEANLQQWRRFDVIGFPDQMA
ncbi:MAG: FkbM family methyltransferase [Verrucomicrobiota bacterium]